MKDRKAITYDVEEADPHELLLLAQLLMLAVGTKCVEAHVLEGNLYKVQAAYDLLDSLHQDMHELEDTRPVASA